MFAVSPITITDAMLTSSIPEPDSSVGEVAWSAGTYNLGDRRIKTSTHLVYEVVTDPSTSDDPEVGAAKAVPTWVVVGPTNKWAQFDNVNNTQSTGEDIDNTITPGSICSTIAGVNITGAESVVLTVTSSGLASPRTYVVPMIDNTMINDNFDWFFSPIILRSEFVVNNLPSFSDAEIRYQINGPDVGIGSLLLGNEVFIGIADYGGNRQSLNFGSVNEDSFGNVVFKKGNKARLLEIPVTIDTARIGYTSNLLDELIDEPTLYYATGAIDDPTLIYGYIRQYRTNFSSPSKSDLTLQIRGLA